MEKEKLIQHINTTFDNGIWFICFGTLLFYARSAEKKEINQEQDIDIGVIGSIDGAFQGLERNNNPIIHYINNDITGEKLNFAYKYNGVTIDVFRFIEKNGYYYHTYDHLMTNPRGVVSEYLFKGIPCGHILPPESQREKISEEIICDTRYGRAITKSCNWQHTSTTKNEPPSSNHINLPHLYGSVLDVFYPDWLIVRSNFGVSKSPNQKIVTSCRNL